MKKGFDANGQFKSKHAMHLIRLLHSGIHALKEGEIRVDVAEHRDELLAIRSGNVSFSEVEKRTIELDRLFKDAFIHTSLPEKPDTNRVNRFLIASRRRGSLDDYYPRS